VVRGHLPGGPKARPDFKGKIRKINAFKNVLFIFISTNKNDFFAELPNTKRSLENVGG